MRSRSLLPRNKVYLLFSRPKSEPTVIIIIFANYEHIRIKRMMLMSATYLSAILSCVSLPVNYIAGTKMA